MLCALALLLATATFTQTPGYPQSPAQVEQEIQQAFRAQPALSNAKLSVAANLSIVTVNGRVANENQHQLALRVATLHANGLRVVDDIKVPQ